MRRPASRANAFGQYFQNVYPVVRMQERGSVRRAYGDEFGVGRAYLRTEQSITAPPFRSIRRGQSACYIVVDLPAR